VLVGRRGTSCREAACWSDADEQVNGSGRAGPTAARGLGRRSDGGRAGQRRRMRRPSVAANMEVTGRSQAGGWGVLAGGGVLGSRRQEKEKQMFFL
jgi:hypothetical protein